LPDLHVRRTFRCTGNYTDLRFRVSASEFPETLWMCKRYDIGAGREMSYIWKEGESAFP